MSKITGYFSETVAELKKVVWPSFDKVMDNTKVVIISTIIVAIFFGAVDLLLAQAARFLF